MFNLPQGKVVSGSLMHWKKFDCPWNNLIDDTACAQPVADWQMLVPAFFGQALGNGCLTRRVSFEEKGRREHDTKTSV